VTSNMLKHKDDRNSLDRLEQWFRSMCNGDWEHTYGLKIETLDNPGWIVTIDLRDTPLFGLPFSAIRQDHTESDWLQCEIFEGNFRGTGGLDRLDEILKIFLDWAEVQS
jgi:hypothetical protein